MAKVSLNNLNNLQNEISAINTINLNNDRLEVAMEKTLSRDGTGPNEMNANLDMNSHLIYNLPKATAPSEPVRKQEFDNLLLDIQAQVGPAYLSSYDNTTSGLTASNVQDAIDELAADNNNFNERVDDRVATFLQAGTNITLSYNDALNTLTIASTAGGSGGPSLVYAYQEPGVVADGVADDASALQAAIDDLPAGATLDGGGKLYKINSTLTLKSNMRLRDFEFDFTGAVDGDNMLGASGVEGSSVAITAGGNRYENTITASSVSGLSVGQYIRIRSGDSYEVNTNASEGEFVRVLGISGNVITIRDSLHANYTTTPVFYKPTFIENLFIENIRARGGGSLQNGTPSSDHYGIRIYYGFNVHIKDCRFDLFDTDNIEMSYCYNYSVQNSYFTRTYDSGAAATTGGESYGIANVNTSSYGYILNNYFEDMRHPIMTGGVEGVVRYIWANGNQMNGCRAAGIDTHPAADMIHFCNNVVSCAADEMSTSSQNGIQHFGGTAIISNNIIRGARDIGIACQIWPKNRPVSLVVTGNQIERTNQGTGTTGIYVEASNGSSRLESVVISGNAVRDNYAKGISLYLNNADLYHFNVSNNTLGTVSDTGIVVQSTTGRLAEMGVISGNTMRSTGSTGCIRLVSPGTIQRVVISGNVTYGGTHGVLGSSSGVDRLAVTGNVFYNFSSAATADLGTNSTAANNVTT